MRRNGINSIGLLLAGGKPTFIPRTPQIAMSPQAKNKLGLSSEQILHMSTLSPKEKQEYLRKLGVK